MGANKRFSQLTPIGFFSQDRERAGKRGRRRRFRRKLPIDMREISAPEPQEERPQRFHSALRPQHLSVNLVNLREPRLSRNPNSTERSPRESSHARAGIGAPSPQKHAAAATLIRDSPFAVAGTGGPNGPSSEPRGRKFLGRLGGAALGVEILAAAREFVETRSARQTCTTEIEHRAQKPRACHDRLPRTAYGR